MRMNFLDNDLDYWFYSQGFNIIPIQYRLKKPIIPWKEWQNKAIPTDVFEVWKKEGLFKNGFMIFTGRIWRGPNEAKYLVCIDIDNKKGLDEFFSVFKENKSIEVLSQHTIVVQHEDAKDERAHIYFITDTPIHKICGITFRNGNNKEIDIEIPKIEVKSDSSTLLVGPGTIHKNGYPYRIQGTKIIQILDEKKTSLLETVLNNIYVKYDRNYKKFSSLPNLYEMDEDDYAVYEGNNRHLNLLRKIDSWYSLSNKQLTFNELVGRANIWNKKHLKPPLKENEMSDLVKQSMNWIDEKSNIIIKSDHNENNTKHEKLQYEINNNNESLDDDINKLFDLIPDKNFVEFVINTAQKTIKQENSLTRLITYTALSAYTKEPLNLGIIAPTSEGKTYPVNEIIKFFPNQDVWLIGSMSPKVIVRDKGILVDENNDPIKEDIKELKKLIGAEKNELKKEDLRRELDSLYEKSKVLIDLTNKILVFLEPPHQETWNILKPILSHDNEYIEHPYVYKTETSGQEVKHIVTKGWPACIFCSAKDESNWPTWPEIQSRFFITSPNMIKLKYKESNQLIGQKQGLPSLLQEQLIVSLEQVEIAKNCILLIKKELMKNLKNGVWIPYHDILSQSLPYEKGTDVRITLRIFTLLKLITKVNLFDRFKLKFGNETMSISSYKDLEEVLKFTQNISGIPSYKLDFFTTIFVPLFNLKREPDTSSKDDATEERIALTITELSEYYKKIKGKAITADNIKKTYLNELKNNGLIDEMGSKIDRRRKIFFPIIDTSSFNSNNNNYTNLTINDNNLQYFRLLPSNNSNKIADNWLEIEIIDLIKYGIGRTNIFKLLDEDNNEICICQFIKNYHMSGSLIRYFQSSENCIYSSKAFGEIIKL
jgi:hypothetical protein